MGPPKVSAPAFPGPTKIEQDILQRQLNMLQNDEYNAKRLFDEGIQDRANARAYLGQLQDPDPYSLDPREISMLNAIVNDSYDLAKARFENSVDKNIFDKDRADTIGNLARRGVLDSSVGERVIGQQNQILQNYYKELALESAANRSNLVNQRFNDSLNRNQRIAELYFGGGQTLPQIGNQVQAQAVNNARSIGQAEFNQRVGNFNAQSQAAQYNALQSRRSPIGSALGGALSGGLAGVALAPMTGGSSLFLGGLGALAGGLSSF